ncbi:hypothetical protein [Nitrospira sp. Nam74]
MSRPSTRRLGDHRSAIVMATLLWLLACPVSAQETIFAVVTNVAKDKRQVTADVSVGGTVSQATLTPTEEVLDNLIWRNLEICHALKADGLKIGPGYRITSVKALDAGMLPMALQGVAGECLLKKALEFAPLVD